MPRQGPASGHLGLSRWWTSQVGVESTFLNVMQEDKTDVLKGRKENVFIRLKDQECKVATVFYDDME